MRVYEIFSSSIFKHKVGFTHGEIWLQKYFFSRLCHAIHLILKRVRTYNDVYIKYNIPVKRRMSLKKLKPHVALTFYTDMIMMMWLHYNIRRINLNISLHHKNFI